MTLALSDDYLKWLGDRTRERWERGPREMGKHSHPNETSRLIHRGYQCEACKGFWAALEPEDIEPRPDTPCLVTEGCQGDVVALYPTDDPPPDWVPVYIPER